jgi:hypothetical protein
VSRLPDDARDGGASRERLSTVLSITERSHVAAKDKNSKKSREKKRPQMSLKEKRQAKRERK